MAVETQGVADDGEHRYGKEQAGNDLLELIHEHDKKKLEFHTLLASLAGDSDGVEDAIPVINFRGKVVARSWYDILCKLGSGDGYTDEAFTGSVATLWTQDEIDRVKVLNEAGLSYTFTPIAEGEVSNLTHEIRGIINVIVEQSDDTDVNSNVLDGLVEAYADSMEHDLTLYVEGLQSVQHTRQNTEKQYSFSADRLKRLLPHIGKHALDVAKLAGGVATGIVIGSLLKRG